MWQPNHGRNSWFRPQFQDWRCIRPIRSTGGGPTLTNPETGTRHSNRERLAAEGVLKVTRVRSELGRRSYHIYRVSIDLARKIKEIVSPHCIRYFSVGYGASSERIILSCIIRFLVLDPHGTVNSFTDMKVISFYGNWIDLFQICFKFRSVFSFFQI